ncbi:SusC/RagA family TonB-linked outer membrane protein [Niabella sp. CC-SYL272]|uniref:SusC/RagA family TonB-linked outer membrane protein n=1 Tax=Niabella agricola TaxID=2891571 RepID=UPI001F3C64BF|nr:SusC/RagA family TonB-linked outer membrane protein [Niabella agricola]MCF3107712.1 SusC/RagA family TonB-linked outer membrane protein [Niabella agricola]
MMLASFIANEKSDCFPQSAKRLLLLLCFGVFHILPGFAQTPVIVTGKVIGDQNEPVGGASINEENTRNTVVTSANGRFRIVVSGNAAHLVISAVSHITKTIAVADSARDLLIQLSINQQSMEDVVVIGYGRQKREGMVAAISQTGARELERTGGVTSLGAALTGNLPGLITAQGSGTPGEEDPRFIIRGVSSLNGSDPLILVDGVERTISNLDISSVESVTVLKDASATAVFGSRGANGVILVTTKRGKVGKADIRATVNTIMKRPSRLPAKLDAYDAFRVRNAVIEYELPRAPEAWADIMPGAIMDKYRNPANAAEAERYPNVDWIGALFKDHTWSQNANLNIQGGTRFVKYFSSADYTREGDIFKVYENRRGYTPGFGFNRINVRSNLDFQITNSTVFKVNLAGTYGVRKSPYAGTDQPSVWSAAYFASPAAFLPVYSDGAWGYYAPNEATYQNSAMLLSKSGIQYLTTARITTDFTLEQNLDMLVKGLKFNGTLSFDNSFVERNRGLNDADDMQRKWINPLTGITEYRFANDNSTNFDFQSFDKWAASGGTVDGAYRRVFYSLQLNYTRQIARAHQITLMGLMNRNQYSTGSEIPHYREDWVFRTTYGFRNKYTVEYNGAYNGSEQFAPDKRFAFFSSGGLGWIVTKERFLKNLKFLDLLKLRASYGTTGNDNIGNSRFLYLTEWSRGGNAIMGINQEGAESSTYTWYRETRVGNPNVQWEEATKYNIGVDLELLKGFITGKFDLFWDHRTNILLQGGARAVPSYFGALNGAPPVNLGEVKNKGYELELHIRKNLAPNLRAWSDLIMTHAQNKVIEADDPALRPAYQNQAGYEVGTWRGKVSNGYYNTWDALYGSALYNANDNYKLPGNLYLVDYNGDGIIDDNDNIPWGYGDWPLNSYNVNFGIDWKGLSLFIQFYAVNDVNRDVAFNSLNNKNLTVYDNGSYWSPSNQDPTQPMPRWSTTPAGYYRGNFNRYDASYIRLKNAEIAYTFTSKWGFIKRTGFDNIRLYLNGNNLVTWTKMPDDREQNIGGASYQGAYPTMKRFNLGANITF